MGLGNFFCARASVDFKTFPEPKEDLKAPADAGNQVMVVAGGCFWCTEGVFENTPGVVDVVSGYAGGTKETADYETVSTGTTNHAEAIRIVYDPKKTSFGKLLKVFFSIAHDPTELNYQGPDHGRQYRSAVFFANDDQKRVTEMYIRQLNDAKIFGTPIVTTVEPLNGFYSAEAYHQDFVKNNPFHPYIMQQALPKVEKAKKAAAATSQPAEK
ncbi:MAG TPA: peptide-methionine (S)-S-oxide reductase MsrA [Tepidisphaeraceae bacterium]|nr:peptide-methionine (S)-S-oxide reductase MsrA [Tepidisphaeraceae bacterium]